MPAVVHILDPKHHVAYRYTVFPRHRRRDAWEVLVTRVGPGAPQGSVLLPENADRPSSQAAALELAWQFLSQQHPGCEVPAPRTWVHVA